MCLLVSACDGSKILIDSGLCLQAPFKSYNFSSKRGYFKLLQKKTLVKEWFPW